jgi:N-acetylglucosaminyldiphosphoundecaprenol N-acetyl-beta-D-mannosaminyltransferase
VITDLTPKATERILSTRLIPVTRPTRLLVAGCPVDCVSLEDAVMSLCACIEYRQSAHVVFVNALKAVMYQRDVEVKRVMDRATYLLADGVPLIWFSNLQGTPLPGRVNGTDLMERMVDESSRRGYRVFLLGATEEVLRLTVDALQERHPDLQVAGWRNGYFTEEDIPTIVRQVRSSGADLLLLAMSTPLKEVFADRWLDDLGVAVCQGVGGSFDVVAGTTRRAPLWMQRNGLEWFYRFLQEPGRMWRRYLATNSIFLWLGFKHVMRTRLSRPERVR